MARRLLRLALLLCCAVSAFAQTAPPAVSDADRAAIKQTALDYVEGWYAGDAERMARALHPELVKRIVRADPKTGRNMVQQMGASTLVEFTRAGGGTNTPVEKQQKDVVILDVFANVASVRATMSDWIDYMHIAKFNGRWVIVNVLWEMKPKQP